MEANMDDMQQGNMQQGSMDRFMHNTFWLEDRICVAFAVPPSLVPPDDATVNRELHLQVQGLNENIKDLGFALHFFGEEATQAPQPVQDNPPKSNTFPPGVYLFRPPSPPPGAISPGAKGVGFLRLEQ